MNRFFNGLKKFYVKHPIISNIIFIILTGIVLLWFAMLCLDVWTRHGDDSTVPQVKGLSYDRAAELLADCDLKIEISDSIYDRNVAPGTVIESFPHAGAVVKSGRQVYVTVTAFSPKMVTLSMPVTGVSSRQAVSYLEALGITSIRLVDVPSQYSDLVEGATYDGHRLSVGSVIPVTASVTLEVGTGPSADEFAVDSLDVAIDSAIDDINFEE